MKKTTKNTIGNIDNILATAASDFANNVLDIVRQAVVGDLMGMAVLGGKVRPAVPVLDLTAGDVIPATRRARGGRLARRTGKDINRALERVQAVLVARKVPLRAEQLRAELNLPSKAMPRVLKAGLATGVLRSKGQKRATTYELVAASAAPHPAKKPAKMAGKGKKA